MRLRRTTLLAAFGLVVSTASLATADIVLTATERENKKLVTVNLTTNVVTTVFNTPDLPDSLIIDTLGRYIYSEPLAGDIRRFDPATSTDIVLANTLLNQSQDLALDPAGTILYVANIGSGTITKTNLAAPLPNSTVCGVAGNFPGVEGMVFDNTGRFFILAGFNNAAISGIYQINPATCAIINSHIGFDPANQLDGLTFDPSTGRLFATSSGLGGSNAVYSIDPTTLAAVKIATVPSPDGIINNANGILYIASRTGFVYSVNESTFAVAQLTPVPTIDDLGIVAALPPQTGKTFTPPSVPSGGTSTVTITITNTNTSLVLGGVSFTDTLVAGLTVAATPGLTNTCGGTITGATTGSSIVALSGGSIAAGGSCTVTFNVTDTNVSGTVSLNCAVASSTNGGTDPGPVTVVSGRCANLTATSLPPMPPTGSKTFTPATVLPGGNSTVTITITNPNVAVALTGVAFTDALPVGVTVAASPNLTNTCGGTVTGATVGSGNVSLSAGTIAGSASCTVKFDVTDTNPGGTNSNNCVTPSSTNGGPDTGGPRCATLMTSSLFSPLVSKSFGAATLFVGGSTTMTISINNPAGNPPATNVNFSDNFAATAPGLVVASPNGLVNTCGGVATASTTIVTLTGGTIAPGGTCAVTINVTGTAAGTQVNNVSVNATLGTTPFTIIASASLVENLPPAVPPGIVKSFSNSTIPVGATTTLNFLVTNPNAATTLSGVNFVDNFPVGLIVATPVNLVGSCGGGTITAVAGSNSVSLSGATLGPLASCSFSVNVTAIAAGPQLNTTSNIRASGGFVGDSSSAPLNVNPPQDAYQIDYLPNVQVDGAVDIANAGTLGADPFGPRSGTTGRICANVYVFSPDEQEISCCSCLLTPNSLNRLSASDLISNTATGVKPDSVVVKLLFTIPGTTSTTPGTQAGPFTGSSCNAAFPFTLGNLAPGGRAWATKLHTVTSSPVTYSTTETIFNTNPIDLGGITRFTVGEITKLTTLCQFIVGNQSGAGLCRGCTLGGLGSVKQ